jgi:hypothetical protein
MSKLQKLVLVPYALAVFVITFAYVPYVCYFEDGIRKYNGHHMRAKASQLFQYEGTRIRGFCEIDSSLVFVEVFTITLMAVAVILFLKKRKS